MNTQKIANTFIDVKEQFNSLMQISAQLIDRNSQIDRGLKCDTPPVAVKFETLLEDFLSSCNSLELQLRTLQECLYINKASQQNLPITISPNIIDPVPQPLEQGSAVGYNQYLNVIKYQVNTAKSIQQLLEDYVSNNKQNPTQ